MHEGCAIGPLIFHPKSSKSVTTKIKISKSVTMVTDLTIATITHTHTYFLSADVTTGGGCGLVICGCCLAMGGGCGLGMVGGGSDMVISDMMYV